MAAPTNLTQFQQKLGDAFWFLDLIRDQDRLRKIADHIQADLDQIERERAELEVASDFKKAIKNLTDEKAIIEAEITSLRQTLEREKNEMIADVHVKTEAARMEAEAQRAAMEEERRTLDENTAAWHEREVELNRRQENVDAQEIILNRRADTLDNKEQQLKRREDHLAKAREKLDSDRKEHAERVQRLKEAM